MTRRSRPVLTLDFFESIVDSVIGIIRNTPFVERLGDQVVHRPPYPVTPIDRCHHASEKRLLIVFLSSSAGIF
jgi:hypothetical protein